MMNSVKLAVKLSELDEIDGEELDENFHEYWDELDEICREHSTPKALRSSSAWLLLLLLLLTLRALTEARN
jgi:hypothetical protein